MENKIIINQLELANAPITAYEFSITKNDKDIIRSLEKSSLYVIAQRPVFTFENLTIDNIEYCINFEIHQKKKPNILHCKLPLIQKVVGSTDRDTIHISFNYLDKKTKHTQPPYGNLHGFSLSNKLKDKLEFLIWFSPEKILYNWWNKQIDCELTGDYRSFLNYPVHYVGKATKQSVVKRLTGHNTFQDILSLESSVTELQLPANEIVVLFFQFKENLQLESFNTDSDIDKMVSSVLGESLPDQESVFLDVEKALVKYMKPLYNKELFKSYPKSTDGLYKNDYNVISYTFMDPIKLIYKAGEIAGGLSSLGGDSIIIKNNSSIEFIKMA